MTLSEQVPWWLDHVAMPASFVFLGAAIGFVAGRLNDWLNARIVKGGFLKAIRVELLILRNHLEGTLKDANEVIDLKKKGIPKVLHFAPVFQTGVYTCQVGKLRDISNPLVLEIIRFYDQLSNLERVKNHTAARAFELTGLTTSKEDSLKGQFVSSDYFSSLEEVIRRINQLLSAANGLINKLPQ